MQRMISVADAQARILASIARPTEPETVPLGRALGRVAAREVAAPFDVPPADNSAVDGYAVRSADLDSRAPVALRIVGDVAAGGTFEGDVGAGEAVRIMTGAPMPTGADTVVPQELAEAGGGVVRVSAIAAASNVRARGEDVHTGTVVVRAGVVLRPQELGLLASLGLSETSVHTRPRVAILSTGDEVVEPGCPRRAGQIYDANRFSLAGLVETAGATPIDLGIVPDVPERLRARLREAAEVGQVVLTSGGVSVGVHDLVKAVLSEIGGIDFWQVAMQPGRPLAIGRIGQAHFFGLPGNPVASMLCFQLFARPALWKLGGRHELEPAHFLAVATEPMRKKAGRREYKRGVLTFTERGWEVTTTGPQGSGILSSLVRANCLIVLEEPREDVKLGEWVRVEPL
jgi:molybdopterin molybdotransferase